MHCFEGLDPVDYSRERFQSSTLRSKVRQHLPNSFTSNLHSLVNHVDSTAFTATMVGLPATSCQQKLLRAWKALVANTVQLLSLHAIGRGSSGRVWGRDSGVPGTAQNSSLTFCQPGRELNKRHLGHSKLTSCRSQALGAASALALSQPTCQLNLAVSSSSSSCKCEQLPDDELPATHQ